MRTRWPPSVAIPVFSRRKADRKRQSPSSSGIDPCEGINQVLTFQSGQCVKLHLLITLMLQMSRLPSPLCANLPAALVGRASFGGGDPFVATRRVAGLHNIPCDCFVSFRNPGGWSISMASILRRPEAIHANRLSTSWQHLRKSTLDNIKIFRTTCCSRSR